MAAIDFWILTLEIFILGILQVRVNNAQADRIDELIEKNKNLQNKVDKLDAVVYNSSKESVPVR